MVLAVACAAAAITAAVAFSWLLHPRGDIATALETPRFLLKFVLTLTLTVTAAATLFAAARPGARVHTLLLAVTPILAALAVLVEFAMVPRANWDARWIGTNHNTA